MTFDPYYQWLGIRDPARPPNHYRLLGIELFEADSDVIVTAADRQMAHLRTFQHGQDSEISQQLLNEVAAAKVCLLNAAKKAAYDEQLRTAYAPQAPPVPAKRERPPEPELPRVVAPSGMALRPPGRSARQKSRRRLIAAILLIPPIAVAVGYGLTEWQRRQGQAQVTADADSAEGRTPGGATGAADPGSPSASDQKPTDGGSGETSRDEAEEAAPTTPTGPSEPSPKPAEPPPTSVWDAPGSDRVAPQFAESDPLRTFLLLVSRRDLSSAEAVLADYRKTESRPNQPPRVPEIDRMTVAEAENVLFLIDRFWQAVGEAHSKLVTGVTLNYRQQPVTVASVTPTSVVLQAADGQKRAFDLRQSDVPIDVAIALAEWQFADARPAAWRMIGCVLSVDQDGDQVRAQEYFAQAEMHGFSAQQLVRFFDRRNEGSAARPGVASLAGAAGLVPSRTGSGSPGAARSPISGSPTPHAPASPPGTERPAANTDDSSSPDLATTTDTSNDGSVPTPGADAPPDRPASPGDPPRWPLPSPAAQSAVRQDILLELRGEISELLERQERARLMLEKAAAADQDPIRYYVLLREALTHAMASGEVATMLSALDTLLTRYEIVESVRLQLLVLETLERSLNQDTDPPAISSELVQQLAHAWRRLGEDSTITAQIRERALERAQFWEQRSNE